MKDNSMQLNAHAHQIYMEIARDGYYRAIQGTLNYEYYRIIIATVIILVHIAFYKFYDVYLYTYNRRMPPRRFPVH